MKIIIGPGGARSCEFSWGIAARQFAAPAGSTADDKVS